ncbi:MAG: chloride channel protein [Deltaproteobacteria bacterium HGW-Deltaproteobacteria-15]|nr:MAG: chloride channel protein [Deltaproteobacteria bacterium HGW-Deltaproteobacteria-15]
MAVLATIVGLAAGYGAIGFRWLIEFFQGVSYGDKGDLLELALSIPWYQRLWIPALGGLVVGPLVYFFAREAKGHGVPEVMEAVALRRGIIRKRVVIVKTLASALTIGTGGSVGREGPIVQIGSAIGSTFGQMLRLSGERTKTLVGCGAAAGIAATFNAPIAGTMFALEIILGDFGLATFSPIVISSVVSTAVSRHYLGNYPAFQVPSYQLLSAWELPLYVLLGLFCAVIAVVFTKTVYGFEDFFSKIRIPEYLKATLGGLVLGMIAIWFPHVLGVGYPAIDLALMGKLSWWFLFLLILVKILATSITLGGGGSGGIFAPSLFLGAMAGGFFGIVVNEYLPGVTASPGAYSIVGMAALVSGTTHGPLGAILILFEMTGNYRIILPLMIACIISSVLSGQLLKESIYTMKLIRRGVDIRAGKEVNVLKSIPVKEAMKNDVETVPETMSLGRLAEKIATSKYNSFPVLNAGGKLVGVLSYLDYHDVLFDPELHNLVVAGELATRVVVTVSEEDSLFTALGRITSKDFSILPVVGRDDPLLIRGVVTRRDIMSAYNSAVTKKDVLSG